MKHLPGSVIRRNLEFVLCAALFANAPVAAEEAFGTVGQ